MSNNVSILKITFMVTFLFVICGVLLILQSETIYLSKINNSSEIANKLPQQTSLTPAEIQNIEQDEFLLIYDPSTESSVALKNNFEMTLTYMKKTYNSVPVKQIPKEIEQYKTIIILFSSLEVVDNFGYLTDYVSKGGKMFLGIRPDTDKTYERIHELIGINEFNPLYKDTTIIKVESDILINSKGLEITDRELFSNSVLDISLDKKSTVLASTDKRIPFLWSTPYGSGTFMVFNGTMLEDKMNRGIIAGALSYLNNNFIYPILNSKVVYIDDFPAPFPEGTHTLIYRHYKTNIANFFRKIWWPDMLRIAKKYDMKFTVGIIQNYNNDVDGPFNERHSEENLKLFGRDVINIGGELAVHGYNHQSLTMSQQQVEGLGYTAWKEEKDMIASLKELNKYVIEFFPDYTLKTYIPPSNVLSEEGKRAIKEAIPSVSNIASLHLDDEEEISYIQEFEYSGTYSEIPRLTSDYHYNDEVQWMIANGATLYGTFSHFIHPDDILDVNRSQNKGWPELSLSFRKMLQDVKEKYPWMESHTASQSAESLRRFQDSEVFLTQDEKNIEGFINNFQGELDFILRSDKEIVDFSGCEIKKIGSDHYFIRAESAKFTIALGA